MFENYKSKMHGLIASSATEVVEKMFFKKIVPVQDEVIFPYEIIVTIGFRGKFQGTFWIIIPKELSYILTAAFLSMPVDEVDYEIVQDTIKEIINMVCGNIIYNFDKTNRFEITIPDIFVDTNANNAILQIPSNSHSFCFTIDKLPLKMILHIEQ